MAILEKKKKKDGVDEAIVKTDAMDGRMDVSMLPFMAPDQVRVSQEVL